MHLERRRYCSGVTRETPEQQVEWLTDEPVTIPWPDEGGPFVLGAHLARVNGKVVLAGLTISSFTEEDGVRRPGPQGVREVDYAAIRSLKVTQIADAARLMRAVSAAMDSPAAREAVREVLSQNTSPPPSAALERVAELYAEALSRGGWDARRPAVYVHRRLTETGVEVTPGTVRGQIHRARQRGLIPPR